MSLRKAKREFSQKLEKDLKSAPNNGHFIFLLPGNEFHFYSENGKLIGPELGVSILKDLTPVSFHKYLQIDPDTVILCFNQK
jgi:hypothetical protein